MAVSVGTKHGVIQLNNGFILPEFIIKKAKCKDMSTQRFYDKAGVKLPKWYVVLLKYRLPVINHSKHVAIGLCDRSYAQMAYFKGDLSPLI